MDLPRPQIENGVPTSDKDGGGGCDSLSGGLALLGLVPMLSRKRK